MMTRRKARENAFIAVFEEVPEYEEYMLDSLLSALSTITITMPKT